MKQTITVLIGSGAIGLACARRAGTLNEITSIATIVMRESGAFVSRTVIFMNGGATASHFYPSNS